jgi:hypothetical protein
MGCGRFCRGKTGLTQTWYKTLFASFQVHRQSRQPDVSLLSNEGLHPRVLVSSRPRSRRLVDFPPGGEW